VFDRVVEQKQKRARARKTKAKEDPASSTSAGAKSLLSQGAWATQSISRESYNGV